jgi:DNA-binding NtrC family response regulator
VEYFMHRYGPELVGNSEPQIHADALECLQKMSWPGNVRELENVVRRALVSSHGIISLGDVQESIAQDTVAKSAAPLPAGDQPLAAYISELLAKVMRSEVEDAHARVTAVAERELCTQAIQLAGGDQTKAAKWLGVSRPTMREKLVRYGLYPPRESKTEVQA